MASAGYHILYAEDHDDTRVLMITLLERAGFRVTGAVSAAACLQLARSARFDLYLLDHILPDATGVALCRTLREFDPATPILFYSACAMLEEREAALQAGAQAYLVKPTDMFSVAGHAARLIERAATS